MPIKKFAKKALRQSFKKRSRNLLYKNRMKRLDKEFSGFIKESKINEARKLLPQLYKILDKAAKEKVIKKNTASRRKSRLTKLLQKIEKK